MKDKIKEILNNRADYYIDSNGNSHDIIRGHPDDIMDEIVKLFAIPDVSQRSELLKAFYAYIDDKWALGMLTDKVDEVIEGFDKSL